MSQVFACDSQSNSTSITVTTTTETTLAATNPIRGPFENWKASVKGMCQFVSGTTTSAVTLRIRRNINAENVLVAAFSKQVTAGNTDFLGCQGADVVPDGRDCTYTLTIQQTAATANGTGQSQAVEAIAISG